VKTWFQGGFAFKCRFRIQSVPLHGGYDTIDNMIDMNTSPKHQHETYEDGTLVQSACHTRCVLAAEGRVGYHFSARHFFQSNQVKTPSDDDRFLATNFAVKTHQVTTIGMVHVTNLTPGGSDNPILRRHNQRAPGSSLVGTGSHRAERVCWRRKIQVRREILFWRAGRRHMTKEIGGKVAYDERPREKRQEHIFRRLWGCTC
jgi:hypothetical protein